MTHNTKLEKFQGPLDLLLQLIDNEEMDITEVALSEITEQYLSYLDKLENKAEEELADFLVVATKLVYLKSRYLLPEVGLEEEDAQSLASQLKLYKKFIEASNWVNDLWNKNQIAYGRNEPPLIPKEFVLPPNAGSEDLRLAFIDLLKRIKPIAPIPHAIIDRGITVKDKIDNLKEFIKRIKNFNFSDYLSQSKNRTEIIISFLALLELVKDGEISISQKNSFGDLAVKKI